jgi:hypothetical protein
MKVKALVDHINDYSKTGAPGAAIGEDRAKAKGDEYEIPDANEANVLIEAGIVKKVGEKASAKK